MRTRALLLTLLLLEPSPAGAQTFSGLAAVIDGDSLHVGAIEVRLDGIDALESDQVCSRDGGATWPCGRRATNALEGKLRGREVSCEAQGRDRYQRILARCAVDGEDLGAWLVGQGWALAYRRYSERYVPEEAAAKQARRGLWSGEFVPPWDWRHRRHDASAKPPAAGTEPPDECRIKGNISRNGRIYHVPGSPAYARTKIDTSKGERWFCSEAEAKAAGWRPPR